MPAGRDDRHGSVLIAATSAAAAQDVQRLEERGCEVLVLAGETHSALLEALLCELGRRRMSNVLVEGGATVLGACLAAGAIDEVHAFIAPRLVGGVAAPSPIGGTGASSMIDALRLADVTIEEIAGDVYVHGRTAARGQIADDPE